MGSLLPSSPSSSPSPGFSYGPKSYSWRTWVHERKWIRSTREKVDGVITGLIGVPKPGRAQGPIARLESILTSTQERWHRKGGRFHSTHSADGLDEGRQHAGDARVFYEVSVLPPSAHFWYKARDAHWWLAKISDAIGASSNPVRYIVRFLDDPGPIELTLPPDMYSYSMMVACGLRCLQWHKQPYVKAA